MTHILGAFQLNQHFLVCLNLTVHQINYFELNEDICRLSLIVILNHQSKKL